ncbi:hypothetical protein GCM10010435_63270 [Winogradskya consettensis]
MPDAVDAYPSPPSNRAVARRGERLQAVVYEGCCVVRLRHLPGPLPPWPLTVGALTVGALTVGALTVGALLVEGADGGGRRCLKRAATCPDRC